MNGEQILGPAGVHATIELDRLAAFFERLAVAVLVTDALVESGPVIRYVNPRFTAMTGFEPSEALGRTPHFLQGSATDRRATARFTADLRRHGAAAMRVVNYRKSGEPYLCDVLGSRFDLAGPDRTGYIAFERPVLEEDLSPGVG